MEAQAVVSVLDACKAGEPGAWRRLFEQRAHQIFRWAVLLGLRAPEAEDAAQEVLVIAARRIDTCASEGALTTWLYQITRRVVANTRRLTWWRRVVPVAAPVGAAFEHGETRHVEEELTVRRCLERMSRAHAEVLMLADIEGYTREEVAVMIGQPPGTVASRLRLAREAFARAWTEGDAGGEAPDLSWEGP